MRLDIDTLTVDSFDTALPGYNPGIPTETGPSECHLCIPSANTTC